MRRKEKEIHSREELETVLEKALIIRLGLCDGLDPYVVPVCFGYSDGRIYFHSAPDGRKLDILKKNPRVCFEVEADVRMLEAPDACGWSIGYKSVVGAGLAVRVDGDDEKREGLSILMRHYSRKDYSFEKADLSALAVFRIDVEWMTGKAS